ncbi:MAG: hypothetical protein ABSC51_05900 [Gaiellaceae bacterium]
MSQSAVVILAGGVAVIVILLFAIWARPFAATGRAGGKIANPSDGLRVGPELRVEGELSAIPRGYHVWLMLRVGGLLFPREPEIAPRDGRFAIELDLEDELVGPFSLVLMLVGARGQRVIEYWLLEGALGEGFPGFVRIPSAGELDTVHELLPEKPLRVAAARGRRR